MPPHTDGLSEAARTEIRRYLFRVTLTLCLCTAACSGVVGWGLRMFVFDRPAERAYRETGLEAQRILDSFREKVAAAEAKVTQLTSQLEAKSTTTPAESSR